MADEVDKSNETSELFTMKVEIREIFGTGLDAISQEEMLMSAKLIKLSRLREQQSRLGAEAVQQGQDKNSRIYKLSELISVADQVQEFEPSSFKYVAVSPDTKSNKNAPIIKIWERGDRMITTAAGGAFLGGLIGQLPGAITGGVFGAVFGLFVRAEKPSRA